MIFDEPVELNRKTFEFLRDNALTKEARDSMSENIKALFGDADKVRVSVESKREREPELKITRIVFAKKEQSKNELTTRGAVSVSRRE